MGGPSLCKEGSPKPPPRNSNIRLNLHFSCGKMKIQAKTRSSRREVRVLLTTKSPQSSSFESKLIVIEVSKDVFGRSYATD